MKCVSVKPLNAHCEEGCIRMFMKTENLLSVAENVHTSARGGFSFFWIVCFMETELLNEVLQTLGSLDCVHSLSCMMHIFVILILWLCTLDFLLPCLLGAVVIMANSNLSKRLFPFFCCFWLSTVLRHNYTSHDLILSWNHQMER